MKKILAGIGAAFLIFLCGFFSGCEFEPEENEQIFEFEEKIPAPKSEKKEEKINKIPVKSGDTAFEILQKIAGKNLDWQWAKNLPVECRSEICANSPQKLADLNLIFVGQKIYFQNKKIFVIDDKNFVAKKNKNKKKFAKKNLKNEKILTKKFTKKVEKSQKKMVAKKNLKLKNSKNFTKFSTRNLRISKKFLVRKNSRMHAAAPKKNDPKNFRRNFGAHEIAKILENKNLKTSIFREKN